MDHGEYLVVLHLEFSGAWKVRSNWYLWVPASPIYNFPCGLYRFEQPTHTHHSRCTLHSHMCFCVRNHVVTHFTSSIAAIIPFHKILKWENKNPRRNTRKNRAFTLRASVCCAPCAVWNRNGMSRYSTTHHSTSSYRILGSSLWFQTTLSESICPAMRAFNLSYKWHKRHENKTHTHHFYLLLPRGKFQEIKTKRVDEEE